MTERRRLPARSRVSGWPIAVTLAVVAVLLYEIRYALLPFVLAVALAFIVEPVVRWLQRKAGGRRWPGAIVVYLSLLALLGGAVYGVGTAALADITSFLQRFQSIMHGLAERLIGPGGVHLFGRTYTPDAVVKQIEDWLQHALGFGALAEAAGLGIATLLGGILTLVLVAYFIASGPRLAAGALWLVPPERRRSVEQLLPRILPALRRYLVGVLAVVCYTAFVAWLGFGLWFRLPHAVLLSATVGILEIVPMIGPAASAVLVGITAFQQRSTTEIVAMIALIVALRLSIDNLVGPLVLGQAARLHPVIVIFSFIAGAMLFGVIGLILAVPAAVCLKVVLQHYYAEPVIPPGRP